MTHSQLTRVLLLLALAAFVAPGSAGAADRPGGEDRPDEAPSTLVVEMLSAARITGDEVRLGDVAILRGDDRLASILQEAVIYHRRELQQTGGPKSVDVQNVMRVVMDAGIHAGRVHVRGPVECEVTFLAEARPEPAADDDAALLAWAGLPTQAPPPAARDEARGHDANKEQDEWALVESPAAPAAPVTDAGPTLGERLRLDLAERLGLEPQELRLTFRTQDARTAGRRDLPLWSAAPQRAADLGRVSWRVEVDGQVVTLQAEASARVRRAVLARPVARGQILRPEDLVEQEAVITRLADRGLDVAEAVGQQASRDMGMGDVVSADRLSPQLAARRGQVVTVTLVRNGVEVRTLARALEDGAFGQSIRARNEITGQEIHVKLTGSQLATLADMH